MVDTRPLLLLLSPAWLGTGIFQTFGHRMPPMSLMTLAAHARRCGWRTRVVDLQFEKIPTDLTPDLVGITVWTMSSPQSYRVADAFRAKGVPVVLGGVHPSLLPEEALRHADSVVCGEADSIIDTVLADAVAGRLQPLYKGEWLGMDTVPTADTWAHELKRVPLTRYAPLNTLQTTRGCRFNCDFCSVIRINGRGSRHSDPDRVVDEINVIKKAGQHLGSFAYVFFLDDDLAADLEYTELLCETIIRRKCKVTWGAQASIGLAKNPKLVDLAARAGCKVVFTGFESVSRDSLVEANKKNRPGEYGELIEALHKRGSGVEDGFIFGFDTDGPGVFDETVQVVDSIGVDVAHFAVLTPYPGTQTFARMASDGRITSYDWKRYNLYTPVFEPARMTATELSDGLRRAYRNFYAVRPRARRFWKEARRRDPRFHAALTIANQNYATRYRNPHLSPEAGYEADPEHIARLITASEAPAQEALNVAYANVRLLPKPTPKPASPAPASTG
ncbi:MAG: B12-binding domain-containing radical SAM protein [Acidimicrobiales bacterium]